VRGLAFWIDAEIGHFSQDKRVHRLVYPSIAAGDLNLKTTFKNLTLKI